MMKEINRKYWIKYNGAILYDGPAHTNDEITQEDAKIALTAQGGYFARYTSNFDTPQKTEWWWCIRDSPIDISQLKVNKRRDIKLCLRKCSIKKLQNVEIPIYAQSIAALSVEVFLTYPPAYRPSISLNDLTKLILSEERDIWIAIEDATGQLTGVAICRHIEDTVDLSVLRVPAKYNRMCVSAGLVYEICHYYLNEHNYKYISDGQRNIRHKTNFQDFLISTLGFRRAYCKLNIEYSMLSSIIVNLLFIIKCFIKASVVQKILQNSHVYYNLCCVLEQEQIRRSFK